MSNPKEIAKHIHLINGVDVNVKGEPYKIFKARLLAEDGGEFVYTFYNHSTCEYEYHRMSRYKAVAFDFSKEAAIEKRNTLILNLVEEYDITPPPKRKYRF